MAEVGKGRATRHAQASSGEPEEDGEDRTKGRDDDETSEVGDGDAFAAKQQRQAKEQTTYDDDDEEESEGEHDDALEVASTLSSEADDDDNASGLVAEDAELAAQVDAVEQSFLENLPHSTSFSFRDSGCTIGLEFGSDMPKLLLVGIIEKTCLRTVVREIPGITDCFKSKDDVGGQAIYRLTTNGSNIPGLWHFACSDEENLIDEHSVYSNDIFAVLCAYGVEAARTTILREIGGVFDVYKIDVDARHLELIADYMTFDGGYKPFNRTGIATNPSPLLKASYETTAAFISDAALHGDFDDLKTPSGNIVAGRLNLTGTGVFDVVAPVDSH